MLAKLVALTRKGSFTAAIAMLARVSNQVAVVGVTLVATRVLGPADFGVFSIGAALLTLARTMLYTGPFEFLLKAPEERGLAVSRACLVANGVVALGWLILLVLTGLAAPLMFRGAGVAAVILALAPSNLIAGVAGWMEALMLRSGQVRRYYVSTVAVEFGSGIGTAILLLEGCGLWALVAQVYMRMLLYVAIYGLVVKVPAWQRPPAADVGEVLRWSRSRYGSVLVGFLANYSGDLLLGLTFSPAASGLYRAGNRMVTALADMFVQPASLLTTTTLAAERARGVQDTGVWLRLLSLFAAMAFPALALLALVADRVTPIALGPAWAAAGPVVSVFCIARMAGLVSAVSSSTLVVHDRQGRVLAVQGAAAVATGVLTLVAAPFGAVAAAAAAAAVTIVASIALFRSAAGVQPPQSGPLGDAARMVLLPLVGTLSIGFLADVLLRRAGVQAKLDVALVVGLGVAGWAVAAWLAAPALRRGVAVLSDRPGGR
ncbi:oligosaccharide flippase family protein [Novosphingobium cyanobacteriorum]|uniref:Oligosaccharide flippase family protein n=1 Tax=Novosphingobium cyanobacteriorum TaxID=3024215 RepID=A0ABT6CN30_9SPHN|nr:oligosaccharide flippase family protein [Novosphingobium cyanobacteriorum]MDF8335262.1 oligosaccharide flippase family protein [Novosphingobium cyanobacteriorum]